MLQVNGFLLLSVVGRFAAGRDAVQFQNVTVVRYHIVNLERVASVGYDLRLMNIRTYQLEIKIEIRMNKIFKDWAIIYCFPPSREKPE